MTTTEILPLTGVRIADFSWQIAGPTCTRYLGLMGAEVIRIESNRRPDPYRERTISHFINQCKKSITLNLADPTGVDLAKRLIKLSDVVIENFAPGVIDRIGLRYEQLRQESPDLIMVSSAGLGHTGPDTNHVAYGTLVQCYTGWSALQGFPGREPEIGGIWTDPMVGMLQVFLVNAALYRRWEQGEGQYIDLSMAEATTMLLPEIILDYSMNSRGRPAMGNRHEAWAPHGNYPCRGDDQWIGIAVADDGQWQGLCSALGRDDLIHDPRFANPLDRRRNHEALNEIISSHTKSLDAADLMARLQASGIAAGTALDAGQLWSNAHLRSRDFFQTYEGQGGATSREMPGSPWRFNGLAEGTISGQPVRGEHNQYVFRELLALSDQEIEALVEAQVIY